MASAVEVKTLVRTLYNANTVDIPNSVVMVDYANNKKRPPKPYATISFLTPFIEEDERATRLYKDGEGNNLIEVRRSAPEAVFSINVYADELDEALNAVEIIKNYYLHIGGDQLSDEGIAIKSTSNPVLRNPPIVGILETRYGFDLTVQYTIETEKTIGTISTVVSTVNGENLEYNE